MALAELRGVSHAFDGTEALRDVSFEVRPGEVLGLLGPNGAGKTTAIRVLCGLLRPDRGTAAIAGHDVRDEPLAARRRMAFVPDGAPLYGSLSPRRHLELVGRLHGQEEDRIAREALGLLDALGLAERADDPIAGFSRGMRQKTALACALLPRPDLLVLDEPLSGLDAPTTAVMKEILRHWAAEGHAVLYTSHLLDVVERVCDRMVVLLAGRVEAEGSLDELRARAGTAGTLEDVFGTLTHAEDPTARARAVLGAIAD